APGRRRGLGGAAPGIGGIGGGAIGGGAIGPVSPGLGGLPGAPDLPTPGLPAPNTGVPEIEGLYGQTTDTLNRPPAGPIERRVIGTVPTIAERAGTGATAIRSPNRPRTSRIPAAGERRFVSNEVLLGLPSNLSPQALDALARR